jgi:hypothetical protein
MGVRESFLKGWLIVAQNDQADYEREMNNEELDVEIRSVYHIAYLSTDNIVTALKVALERVEKKPKD